ncbi:hypothetical protein F4811DRAFT_538251 [Daldinia bambusicola]|nr:hypothetical protein F4811DRAFT_538251 [Daldinia bambusicola]
MLAISLISHGEKADNHSRYLPTTRVHGRPLRHCQDVLLEQDLEQIAKHLKDYVAQRRNIHCPTGSGNAICNALGEACRNPSDPQLDTSGGLERGGDRELGVCGATTRSAGITQRPRWRVQGLDAKSIWRVR